MTGPRHSSSTGDFARSAGGAGARGLVVVLIAVVLGVFLLARALDDPLTVETSSGSTGGGGGTATTTAETPSTTSADGTATTAVPTTDAEGNEIPTTTTDLTAARPPSQVKIQVANAARVSGAAGSQTQSLQALGYATGTPTNYTGPEILDTSRIHYKLGFLLEAQNLARALNLDPAVDIFPVDAELPIDKADEDPDIVVLLGRDLAAPAN